MMTRENFLKGIDYLSTAFAYKMTAEQFKIYFEVIGELFTDEQFSVTVMKIIKAETRFPAIATIIRYAPKQLELAD